MDDIRRLLFAGAPTQDQRLLRLTTRLGHDVLVAEDCDILESIDGGGFRIHVHALAVDAHLPIAGLVGSAALLELQTAASRSVLRPFHGLVNAVERLGSNGGLARYRLVIEPWLALLRHRVDSYVFQGLGVLDILEDVFADYRGGQALPAWRIAVGDRGTYRPRSLVTQYAESDFAFVSRLLAEAGLHYWFEHAAEPASPTLGAHTLVVADHPEAAADLGAVRFHRADATERDDSVQHWAPRRALATSRVIRASWDYRTLSTLPCEADTPAPLVLEDVDSPGQYAWPDRAEGERLARIQLDAARVDAHTIDGAGTWRMLAPGRRFRLVQHAGWDAGSALLCLSVRHRARNNFDESVSRAVDAVPGRIEAPPPLPAALGHADAGTVAPVRAVDLYANTFVALPAEVPYRTRLRDAHGHPCHPRPTVGGPQPAIVVGDGGPALTDRDHRIRVQFPWQRGRDASSRQAHPAGADNAPGTANAWTWVRVATPLAGANFGSVLLPRVGQEVLVDFIEGDIDRPVVVGAVYNGCGQHDAAHNQVGGGAAGATGNAPAWFAGNGHGAVLTGIKTQAMASSQTGSGGHNRLVFDDTPGQSRVQLATTQAASGLTLGHLKHQVDNIRGADRGFGVELATGAAGAVRSGRGLLLTTEPGRQQLSLDAGRADLDAGHAQLDALATHARQQEADPGGSATLPALDALGHVREVLARHETGGASHAGGGGAGDAPAWSEPLLVASSPAGIVATTPASQVWVSGTQTLLAAGSQLALTSQNATSIAVAGAAVIFTGGAQAPAGAPNQEAGIAFHAAAGLVSAQAQSNTATLAAKHDVTLASTQSHLEIQSPASHILATAAGAYLRMEGGDIELGAPGQVEFKASRKVLTEGESMPPSELVLAEAPHAGCETKDGLQ